MLTASTVRTKVVLGRQPTHRHESMIRTVRIRGFKRFDEVEFRLPGPREHWWIIRRSGGRAATYFT